MRTSANMRYSGSRHVGEPWPALRGLLGSVTVIALLVAAPAGAQTQQADQSAATLQEVVVTGSLIQRTDTETPSPVEIISDQDIKNSGYTNVNDVLRNLASNGQGTLNQSFTEAFAAGASGVALRGLTVGDTLTLIDSERMVAFPLSDDGERSFVDTTAIPFNAVESIEVLKDGASALYGADAIAGVVNIKLKKTYVGTEVTADAGTSQHDDGRNWHAAVISGFGDLASDGYNVYAAVDWHRQELILGANRSGPWTNLNWSGFPNGLNETPGSPTQSLFTYPNTIQGYVVNPTTPNAAGVYPNGLPGEVFFAKGPQPGCNSQAAQAAGACEFSFPGQIQPPTEQLNFLAKFTKTLPGDWKMIWTGSIFNSQAQQLAPETPPFGSSMNQTGINYGSIQLTPVGPGVAPHLVSFPVFTLPANSTLNPYGAPAQFAYSFPDIGPSFTNVDTTTYRLFADVRGGVAGWDLDVEGGLMYALMNDHVSGYIEPAVAQADLNNLSYIPGVTNNGTQLFAPVEISRPSSTLDVADAHATRELFQMPGGPFSVGLGAQFLHKAQNYVNPATVSAGIQEGASAYSVGEQDDVAGFLEVGGKPIRQLEVNAAIRYDHYDTYGGSSTPKFGLKYTPVEMVSLRGTWGRGFRAPSISESAIAGNAFGQGNVPDQVLCPGGVPNVKGTFNALCAYPGVGVGVANPNLKAVTSQNATFGLIFEPAPIFSVSVDYYWIRLHNDIISASAAGGLGAPFLTEVRGKPAPELVCTATVTTGTCPQTLEPTQVNGVLVGYPAYEVVPYINAGLSTTSGIDIDLRSKIAIGWAGRLTGDINYTHMIEYKYGYQGTTYELAGTHGPSEISGDTGNPRDHAVASLTWDKGPLTSTLSVNYISSFSVLDPSENIYTCAAGLASGSPSAYGGSFVGASVAGTPWTPYCSVAHFTEANLYVAYTATENLNLHASITNLFNSDAPVDLQTYGGGGELHYDAALHQDGAVGRYFRVGATYRF